MGAIASQITSLTIVYSIVYSDADQRKHQSSASLAFVRGSHRGPVNSPHKWPVTRKMFPFDDVIMGSIQTCCSNRTKSFFWLKFIIIAWIALDTLGQSCINEMHGSHPNDKYPPRIFTQLVLSSVKCFLWYGLKYGTRPLFLKCIHYTDLHMRVWAWASYQIRKIAGCACAENAGNVFPPTSKEPAS